MSDRVPRQRSLAVTLLFVGVVGCGAPSPSPLATYRPFYTFQDRRADARGSLTGDYHWAESSATLQEAAARWKEFLGRHRPPNGEYQDAFERNYVRSAQYELMRVEYLLGNTAEGDALLRELEDVQGRQ